uniref:Transmembrane protein n=1 Tax=Noctiluca scintillans TaxID=2966 RepID=A0A7S1AVS7_NOCSC
MVQEESFLVMESLIAGDGSFFSTQSRSHSTSILRFGADVHGNHSVPGGLSIDSSSSTICRPPRLGGSVLTEDTRPSIGSRRTQLKPPVEQHNHYRNRAVSRRELDKLLRKRTEFLVSPNGELQSDVARTELELADDILVVQTATDHRLYQRDQVRFTGPGITDEMVMVVKDVRNPTTFEVCGVRGASLARDGVGPLVVSAHLNMHKVVAEVVIPWTTVQERVVCLQDAHDVATLRKHVDQDNAAPLTLKSTIHLKDINGEPMKCEAGLTIHGHLSADGHIRRAYWLQGHMRVGGLTQLVPSTIPVWKTTKTHGRRQIRADPVPSGYAETETFAKLDSIKVGDILVMRKGVSYAEVVSDGLHLTDFISHNWAEPSEVFMNTLDVAHAGNCWVCSTAVCQHQVDLGTSLQDAPFYAALYALKRRGRGRVLMVIGEDASVLTRIWCIYEIWVSATLGLHFEMFSEQGRTNCWEASGSLIGKIDTISVRKAEASRQNDKDLIREGIQSSEVGEASVEWIVKRTMLMSSLVYILQLFTQASATLYSLHWIRCIVVCFAQDFHFHTTAYLFANVIWLLCVFWLIFTMRFLPYSFLTVRSSFRGLWRNATMCDLLIMSLWIIQFVVVAVWTGSAGASDENADNPATNSSCNNGCLSETPHTKNLVLSGSCVVIFLLPWFVLFLANFVSDKQLVNSFRDLEPALPCSGFFIVLIAYFFYSLLANDPFWNWRLKELIVVGLCAWTLSVLITCCQNISATVRRASCSCQDLIGPSIFIIVVVVMLLCLLVWHRNNDFSLQNSLVLSFGVLIVSLILCLWPKFWWFMNFLWSVLGHRSLLE